MILCDVGVLLSVMVGQSPHHDLCKQHIDSLRQGSESIGVSDLILAAVLRIGTNPRAFKPTPTVAQAFAFVDAFRSHPRAASVAPGERHWQIFKDLVVNSGIRGSDTTDAYLAALAIEHGCEWWTTDRDFRRFSGLRWKNLLASERD